MRKILIACVIAFVGHAAASDPSSLFLDRALPFTLTQLEKPARDPSNRFSGDIDAIALGEQLFFDENLSRSGKISCASCHVTDGKFIPNESIPAQSDRTFRSVPSLLGAAYSDFLFWDGRADSLWAQALGPLETMSEHDLTRTEVVQYVSNAYRHDWPEMENLTENLRASPVGDQHAREAWATLTLEAQSLINQRFADVGKYIAAYEETLAIPTSAWDDWISDAVNDPAKTAEIPASIIRGFNLFVGPAKCAQCHHGPLFSDFDFHNTGMPSRAGRAMDLGLQGGLLIVLNSPFNCQGRFSDAGSEDCKPLEFINLSMSRSIGAFRTPTLRSVSQKSVFGHAGQFSDLRDVIRHYQAAPESPLRNLARAPAGSDIQPLNLTETDIDDLVAFLESL